MIFFSIDNTGRDFLRSILRFVRRQEGNMLTSRVAMTRRLQAVVDASPSRIPVLLGGCGSGRTTLIGQLHDRLGRSSAQCIDVGRTATTPERFQRAVLAATPFPGATQQGTGARAAFDATLAFLTSARTGAGAPATFLLDEFLELRTFESFPGLRRVLHDFIDAIAVSDNRFVLTSRYAARTLRLLREQSARFEVIQVPPMGVEDAADLIGPPTVTGDAHEADLLARAVQALTDGRPIYLRALVDELDAMREHGGGDPTAALVSLLSTDGRLCRQCAFSYELRLHRARGYGALKAILDILAEDEGLTLTEISRRLQRTPGSTKDYLSWLEDVDLVVSRYKRYSFVDPLLRVWVRLHCRATAPTESEVVREVHSYVAPRLPQGEPALAMTAAGPSPASDDKRPWGIIEID
jgi:hypothetical protein